jgi:hypothetical protein
LRRDATRQASQNNGASRIDALVLCFAKPNFTHLRISLHTCLQRGALAVVLGYAISKVN